MLKHTTAFEALRAESNNLPVVVMLPLTREHRPRESPVTPSALQVLVLGTLQKDTAVTMCRHHVGKQRCQPTHMPQPLLPALSS